MADAGVSLGSILGLRRRLLKVGHLGEQAKLESLNFRTAGIPVFYDPIHEVLRPC